MKSPSTLIVHHEKALCCLEMLQKAKDRVDVYKTHLKLWNDRHRANWVHGSYRRESEIIAKIISSHQIYQRVKKYYFNLLTKLK